MFIKIIFLASLIVISAQINAKMTQEQVDYGMSFLAKDRLKAHKKFLARLNENMDYDIAKATYLCDVVGTNAAIILTEISYPEYSKPYQYIIDAAKKDQNELDGLARRLGLSENNGCKMVPLRK